MQFWNNAAALAKTELAGSEVVGVVVDVSTWPYGGKR
jgi:hypothetical protein